MRNIITDLKIFSEFHENLLNLFSVTTYVAKFKSELFGRFLSTLFDVEFSILRYSTSSMIL